MQMIMKLNLKLYMYSASLLSLSAQSAYKSGRDQGPGSGLHFKALLIANWVSRCEMGSANENLKRGEDGLFIYFMLMLARSLSLFFPLRDVRAVSGDMPVGTNDRMRQKKRGLSFQNGGTGIYASAPRSREMRYATGAGATFRGVEQSPLVRFLARGNPGTRVSEITIVLHSHGGLEQGTLPQVSSRELCVQFL